jgi:hypothetical protein
VKLVHTLHARHIFIESNNFFLYSKTSKIIH